MAYKGRKLADMNAGERQKRIQALLATHNTSAIPTKYLPSDLRQKRAQAVYGASPVVPGSGLTNSGLAQEARSATELQYGPQQTALNTQMASLANQPRVTGGYYDQYRQILGQAAQQQQAQGQQLVGQIQGIGQDAQNAATAQSGGVLAALQADAAKRGATVDPALATQAAQGAQVNRGINDAQAGTAALQSQAQQNYLGALMAGVQAGKVQALNTIAGQANDVRSKNTELAAQKGAFNVDYRAKRRTEEGQSVLNTALAQSTVDSRNLSGQVAVANAKTARRRASTAAQTAKTTQQTKAEIFAADHGGLTPAQFAAKPPAQQLSILKSVAAAKRAPKTPKTPKAGKPTTGPGSLSDAAEQKRVDQIEKVYGLLTNPVIQITNPSTGAVATKKLTPVQMRDRLRAQAVNPLVLRVALSRFHNKGAVGHDGLSAAHSLGVHVGGRWKVVKG